MIDTVLSCVGLALQIISMTDKGKVFQNKEYKKSLRDIVSLLYYSKNLHNFSHTIIDLDYLRVFDLNVGEVGIIEISKTINNTFGKIYNEEIITSIKPKTKYYEKYITEKTMSVHASNLPNNIIDSINCLNKCFPKMLNTYSELEQIITEIYTKLIDLEFSDDHEIDVMKIFKSRKGEWKHYIALKNSELLTFADKTIFDSITILDYLFIDEK